MQSYKMTVLEDVKKNNYHVFITGNNLNILKWKESNSNFIIFTLNDKKDRIIVTENVPGFLLSSDQQIFCRDSNSWIERETFKAIYDELRKIIAEFYEKI